MKPAPFKYEAPSSRAEALELLKQFGYDAKILAGGQSLVPAMNFRLAQPAVLIDCNRIADLAYLDAANGGETKIGAMTRQRAVELSDDIAERAPLLHETMPSIAHVQIRNRGTVGGSIAHADPASELPAVMIALNARFLLQKQGGERWVSASDFFQGMFTTALEPEEMLVEISIPPLPQRSGWAFREVARRHGDYALAGVAVQMRVSADGRCDEVQIVLMSVGDGPMIAQQAAALLRGETLSPELIRDAAHQAANGDIDPGSDIHASAEYRRHLARVLTEQALDVAWQRARKSK